METEYFCNNCIYLSLTEEEQNLEEERVGYFSDHICEKYDKRIYHGSHHPLLPQLEVCVTEKSKKELTLFEKKAFYEKLKNGEINVG